MTAGAASLSRRSAIAAIVVMTSVAVAWFFVSSARSSDTSELTGDEYAQSLGLSPLESTTAACDRGATTLSGHEYCLDGLFESPHDYFAASLRIAERDHAALELQIFDIQQELRSIPDTDGNAVRRRELDSELLQLSNQLAAARNGDG